VRRIIEFSFCILCILFTLAANNAFPQSWRKGRITFWSTDWSVPGGQPQACIMNADGSDVIKLTKTPLQEGDAKIVLLSPLFLSPDCGKATLQIETAGNSDIAIFEIDSRRLVNLTNGKLKEGCSSPRWSPDGRQIVFQSGGNVCIMNCDGTNIKVISEGRIPDWSYDGRRIVFVKDKRDICIMDVNGKNLSNITRGQMDVSFVSSLRWSPDDKHILFSDRTAGNDRVYIMDSNGDDWELIIELSNMGGDACWSPDGQKVAFPAKIEPEKYWQIWVINPDGSNLERLTNNDVKEYKIDWRDPTLLGVSPLLEAVNTTWGRIKTHS
jgi:dipeptidyl aminopeptidase/acylaminoacyl peptidase